MICSKPTNLAFGGIKNHQADLSFRIVIFTNTKYYGIQSRAAISMQICGGGCGHSQSEGQ